MATIKIYDYDILPRDGMDARKLHFYFQVYDDAGNKIKEGYADVVVTGSLLGVWSQYLPQNQNKTEWEEALAKFTLKLIENEIADFSVQDIPEKDVRSLEFKYWTGNAPEITFDHNEIESIDGYTINLES
ncbi:hypothetical protein [Olivibacter ginsenosidimutans]